MAALISVCTALPVCAFNDGDFADALSELAAADNADIPNKVLRLHIRANSDSTADQTVKLEIRDILTKSFASVFTGGGDLETAVSIAEENCDGIAAAAEEYLRERGFTYGCKAAVVRTDFAEKEYCGISFPAGEYTALEVVLGEGRGHNWWCVLFPPLCAYTLYDAETDTPISSLDSAGVTVRLKWRLSKLF